jgi:two-component system, OmpR family, sensor histidine kinase MtrB
VDRRRVERILRNLLLNAVEHGEDKDVVVTAAMDSAAVAVSVRDFGVGLGPGEEQLVFDRFWRADPARARTSGGTGLGLSIALEDARLHCGWLEAWGQPGKGSVFRLTLPRVVGGALPGSPLPLNPYSAGLDATQLPELGDLAAPATAASDADGLGQAAADAEPGDLQPAEVDASGAGQASDEAVTSADDGSAADGTAGTTLADEVVARG